MPEKIHTSSLQERMSEPRLWNEVAEAFSGDIAPHLALYGEDALRMAQVGPGLRVADVACGTGTLSLAAARLGATVTSIDFSPEMIAQLQKAAEREDTRIDARVGDGMALPLGTASFDAAFSMFGLIFFPDRAKGFRELLRILAPGGRAVVGSWLSDERVPLRADLFRTLAALLPELSVAGRSRALSNADEFRAEMTAAGFRGVEVVEVTHALESPSIEEYWNSLERSTPPVRAVRESVEPERWTVVHRKLIESMQTRWGSGPVSVPMIANLGIGWV
jgi:ubiquinone/menaquinone biosynthesis C-methylase UbiE